MTHILNITIKRDFVKYKTAKANDEIRRFAVGDARYTRSIYALLSPSIL